MSLFKIFLFKILVQIFLILKFSSFLKASYLFEGINFDCNYFFEDALEDESPKSVAVEFEALPGYIFETTDSGIATILSKEFLRPDDALKSDHDFFLLDLENLPISRFKEEEEDLIRPDTRLMKPSEVVEKKVIYPVNPDLILIGNEFYPKSEFFKINSKYYNSRFRILLQKALPNSLHNIGSILLEKIYNLDMLLDSCRPKVYIIFSHTIFCFLFFLLILFLN